jgi:signal transduction histidine kinase/PAS domain-containing protein
MNSRSRSGTDRPTALSIQEALRRFMQQTPLPFAVTRGAEHKLVYANPAFCRLAGIADGDALGGSITAVFGATDGAALSAILDRAFREGVELLDERLDASGGRVSGWQCSVWPVIDDDGQAEALGIEIRETIPPDAMLDLQRQVAEQMLLGALRERGLAEDAEAARRRAAFLAEAGRSLAESVNQASTFMALAKLALPTLGAWCIMDILGDDGEIRRLGIYHPDPEKQKLAEKLEATWLPQPDDTFGAPAMLRDARTIVITDDVEATVAATARNAENLNILGQLGIGSLLTVPLVARKKLLGAITFVNAQHGDSYSTEEIQLAEDLAGRGALALDNAQVYDLALVLQRSAETANKAKTAFLSAMSHELRTPLNAIGGYIELLDMGLRGPVTERQHADFARVKVSQQHLALLITEILTFARVESGQVSYEITDVKACDALQHAIELVEPLFGQKGLVFDGISGDQTVVARADSERVTQILVNLLSNAIKFTPSGGHISADCGATPDAVTLRISDTGRGIPAGKHETIFEPFIQLKEGLAERESGVGLGLAISRDLARAMNGDLAVESNEGKGSRFTLSLPRSDESPGTDRRRRVAERRSGRPERRGPTDDQGSA